MTIIEVSDDRLNSFYNKNPDFDILRFNLLNGQTNNLNWENIERKSTLDLLRDDKGDVTKVWYAF